MQREPGVKARMASRHGSPAMGELAQTLVRAEVALRDRNASEHPVDQRVEYVRLAREVVVEAHRLAAEALGTGLLVAVVIGSGIAAARLSPGDVGLQLLENALATAAGLAVIILLVGPVSGAHLNPVVSLADWRLGRRSGSGLRLAHLGAYAAAQIAGAVLGAILANLMYGLPAVTIATTTRSGWNLFLRFPPDRRGFSYKE